MNARRAALVFVLAAAVFGASFAVSDATRGETHKTVVTDPGKGALELQLSSESPPTPLLAPGSPIPRLSSLPRPRRAAAPRAAAPAPSASPAPQPPATTSPPASSPPPSPSPSPSPPKPSPAPAPAPPTEFYDEG